MGAYGPHCGGGDDKMVVDMIGVDIATNIECVSCGLIESIREIITHFDNNKPHPWATVYECTSCESALLEIHDATVRIRHLPDKPQYSIPEQAIV